MVTSTSACKQILGLTTLKALLTMRQIDYKAFLHFVTDYLGPVYGKMNGLEREQAVAEVKVKLSKASPQMRNTTASYKFFTGN
ncbi:uncharacterized protein DEA37_0000360 [Paragonimus westermani]|uniref:Uncharacterized protein n=1 Tax=Paragonimus westermani TaxID=34504 RepID=A0A5J4NI60_9TREM|nr:uncharacterized protein DEA37_0000360 [Paragonimus westermani]